MTALEFSKYEGLGNDFLVVESRDEQLLSSDAVRRLCDRHFGVGADGVLLVLPPRSAEARARMLVLNADGSRPEMCGNGLRCVALHLARQTELASGRLYIDTDAGLLATTVERTADEAQVEVGMGRARLEGTRSLQFDGATLNFCLASMGNPHAIAFDTGLDESALDRIGPVLSAEFPQGTNVELVTVRDRHTLDLIVWERGVGRTLACGTGAAATAAAAAATGRAAFDQPLCVNLPGGSLSVSVAREDLAITMRGPARLVFSGQVRVR